MAITSAMGFKKPEGSDTVNAFVENTCANIDTLETTLQGRAAMTFSAVLAADAWVGTSAPYTQTVSVEGMLLGDNPITDIVQSSVQETAQNEISAWGSISKITTAAGSITAVCYKTKPAITLNIQLKVVR